jgi:hypothetical protein
MTNPWLKKNPFMSMWLSGANAVAGSLRGHASKQAKRQSATVAKTAGDIIEAWTVGLTASAARPRKRRRR